ncbi:heavy-metal-associated domain-containing protein [Zymomonas mobilis]|uniref:Heavy-metal-associated domain-containing protein n=1 Tax=Zymomonas mobilis TaxID=542 RepID=A0A542W1B3_ZYMMB|nr:cation transporter [Zymomonas mobilis]TQL17329.1 heavy-metal-associated domain-containing protein [Zymomonas mobilis]
MASKQTFSLLIDGMECAACSSRIERVLNRLPNVDASVNFATEKAHVTFDPASTQITDIIKAIEKAGYRASEADKIDNEKRRLLEQKQGRQTLHRFLIALFCSLPFLFQMIAMFLPAHHMGKHGFELPRLTQWVLATIVEFGAGAAFSKPHGNRFVLVQPIWMFWSFWERAWPIFTVVSSTLLVLGSYMSILKRAP